MSKTEIVAPATVPQRKLHTGATMPAVGLGTFGSDHVTAAQVAEAVRGAAAVGYRHFDCASVYGNEPEVGASLDAILRSGIKREELWITSKLWNDRHGENDVIAQCRKSMADLRVNYLDLYLVHWPFPNFHPPNCDVTSRSPGAKPYIHESYMKAWRKMEELVDMGLVRHIGTSNMTIPKLKLVLRDARIKPAVNEMELHPRNPQVGQDCLPRRRRHGRIQSLARHHSRSENNLRVVGHIHLADGRTGRAPGALEPASGRHRYAPLRIGQGRRSLCAHGFRQVRQSRRLPGRRAEVNTEWKEQPMIGSSTIAPPEWKTQLNDLLPLFGHRNWIVVADAAYPAQSRPGIETLVSGEDQLDVVRHVLEVITSSAHVRANVYADKELAFVSEADAPGIAEYRRDLATALQGAHVEYIAHEQIIQKLDQSAQVYRVLIVKTEMTIPYTSVFFELDCGYWNAGAEQRLRDVMSASNSK
jgi:diketogulonate reductase-like aldo/keto reductase/D-ribose pyranose/furanose isomerase RbsD